MPADRAGGVGEGVPPVDEHRRGATELHRLGLLGARNLTVLHDDVLPPGPEDRLA